MTLTELRKQKDMTQAMLAARLGVKQQSVQAIESGASKPSIPVAKKIMAEFDLTPAELWDMFYSDDPPSGARQE